MTILLIVVAVLMLPVIWKESLLTWLVGSTLLTCVIAAIVNILFF